MQEGLERTIIKQFQLVTGEKEKTFSIYHGNVLRDTSDCIGITSYESELNKGELYHSFITENKEMFTTPRTLLTDAEQWTSVSELKAKQQHALLIHTSIKTGEELTRTQFLSLLRMTFASIAAFIYEGNEIETVALPVLFRKGIEDTSYEEYIRLFVRESVTFLQKSPSVHTLRLYIWHEKEAKKWLDVLAAHLQRPKEELEVTIEQLRHSIANHIQSPFYQRLLPPWLVRNTRKVYTFREPRATDLVRIGDQIINRLVQMITELPLVPKELEEGSIFQRILRLKKERILIEWFADYLLFMKQSRYEIKNEFPSKEYALRYMLIFSQVLTTCENIVDVQEDKKGTSE